MQRAHLNFYYFSKKCFSIQKSKLQTPFKLMTRAIVFFLKLKSLGLITKPRLKTWSIIKFQFKCQSNIWNEYENLRQLFVVWLNSWKSHRFCGHLSIYWKFRVFVICVDMIDRSHALSPLSPLSRLVSALTRVCHHCHHCPLFSPADVTLDTLWILWGKNWE